MGYGNPGGKSVTSKLKNTQSAIRVPTPSTISTVKPVQTSSSAILPPIAPVTTKIITTQALGTKKISVTVKPIEVIGVEKVQAVKNAGYNTYSTPALGGKTVVVTVKPKIPIITSQEKLTAVYDRSRGGVVTVDNKFFPTNNPNWIPTEYNKPLTISKGSTETPVRGLNQVTEPIGLGRGMVAITGNIINDAIGVRNIGVKKQSVFETLFNPTPDVIAERRSSLKNFFSNLGETQYASQKTPVYKKSYIEKIYDNMNQPQMTYDTSQPYLEIPSPITLKTGLVPITGSFPKWKKEPYLETPSAPGVLRGSSIIEFGPSGRKEVSTYLSPTRTLIITEGGGGKGGGGTGDTGGGGGGGYTPYIEPPMPLPIFLSPLTQFTLPIEKIGGVSLQPDYKKPSMKEKGKVTFKKISNEWTVINPIKDLPKEFFGSMGVNKFNAPNNIFSRPAFNNFNKKYGKR